MKEKIGKIIKSNKGFTLVETIVVGVILAILLSFGAAGLLYYTHFSTYKKNNEYARSIYVAAQSSLSYYRNSGNLDDLKNLIQNSNNAANAGEVSEDIAAYAGAVGNGQLYYLQFSKEDYETLEQEGADSLNKEAKALYDLIHEYLYQPGIFDAAIRLEIDPVNGVVYSASYTNKASTFVQGSAPTADGALSIEPANREDDVRYDLMLGYYDSNHLTSNIPGERVRSSINKVTLESGETLLLSWNMARDFKVMTYGFQYTIDIYDKAQTGSGSSDDTLLFTIELNTREGNNFLRPNSDAYDNNVLAGVTFYNEDGTVRETQSSVPFIAYVAQDSTQTVSLVLDAADLKAAENLDAGMKSSSDYAQTYSALRLGLTIDETIYARVRATSADYKNSLPRKSNDEEVFVADISSDEADGTTYFLRNARHLFNVRFIEEFTSQEGVESYTYRQAEDIGWGGSDGLIAHGNLYNGQQGVTDIAGSAFPAIASLSYRATFSNALNYTISEIYLKASEASIDKLGIFRTNRGTMTGLRLNNVRVDGVIGADQAADYVGTFCGLNLGTLDKLIVTETREAGQKEGDNCYVTGGNFVGGIAGSDVDFSGGGVPSQASVSGQTCESTHSSATVRGNSYVGGIFGYSNAAELSGCSNQGRVESTAQYNEAGTPDSQYIGGIVGYKQGGDITNCINNYGAVLGELTDDEVKSYLVGQYVGGIAGTVNNVTISRSSTTGGTITGYAYVGGIVGAADGNAVIDGIDGVTTEYNSADVMAYSYAGGIAGSNEGRILNWKNTGVVTVYNEYAGGIAGYNKGTVDTCISDANISGVTVQELQTIYSSRAKGSYIGGLVGENATDAKITANKVQKVNSISIGLDYVGGMVGLNNIGAEISKNYQLTGGYVIGNKMVGGYAGANMSEKLLMEIDDLTVSPNEIVGKTAIGGYWGTNVVALTDDRTISPKLYNFLGTITGADDGILVGGIVGYNYTGTNEAELNNVKRILESLDDTMDQSQAFSAIAGITTGNSPYRLTLNNVTNRMASITGGICVGGMIGYNDKNANMTIVGSSNSSPIIARAAIVSGDRTSLNDVVSYSFVGGMIGEVTEKTVIDNCSNQDSGTISAPDSATYHGGITERNRGIIQNCTANSQGINSMNYVGGIVGRNESKVYSCTVDGTITGSNLVGGIAAENYGTIGVLENNPQFTINRTIVGYGQRIGGAAGYNSSQGIITGANLKAYVSGSATSDYVGGIVGYNEGRVQTSTVDSVNITGRNYVGGIIGFMPIDSNLVLEDMSSSAAVTASGDFAGGLIGAIQKTDTNLSDNAIIQNSQMNGSVTAASGRAGGIVSVMDAFVEIRNCQVNSGVSIRSTNGLAGGITAENNGGRIIDCQITGTAVTAAYNVGGAAALNHGRIQNTLVDNITLNNVASVGQVGDASLSVYGFNMGGITGVNTGTISGGSVGTSSDAITIQSQAANSQVGGITGRNLENGRILSDVNNPILVYAELSFASDGLVGSIGGAAGYNGENASVANVSFVGNVTGYQGGDNSGFGGIVGLNEGNINNCDASGNIFGHGQAAAIAHVGGIAGRLEENASISVCQVGTKEETTIGTNNENNSDYNNVGGIVGWAAGTITNINWDDNAEIIEWQDAASQTDTNLVKKVNGNYTVAVSNNFGHTGGITGFADVSASLQNCRTYGNWTVSTSKTVTDSATGGIVGYSKAGSFSHLVNHANVAKTINSSNSTAGILGRQENTDSNWELSNVINTGEIRGKERTGGIIGQCKYMGGTVRNAQNFGRIWTGNYAGGIIGYIYTINRNEYLDIVDCINWGQVYSRDGYNTYLGGIVGTARNTNSIVAYLRIAGCVNVGNISRTPSGAGIIYSASSPLDVTVRNCVNYGNANTYNFTGISGGTQRTRLQNNLSFANVTWPITSLSKPTDTSYDLENYYFSGTILNASEPLSTGSSDPYQAESGQGGIGLGVALDLVKTSDSDIYNADFSGTYQQMIKGIDFSKLPTSNNASRLPTDKTDSIIDNIKTFLATKSQVEDYYTTHFNAPSKPTNVQVAASGNNYRVSWTAGGNSYAYEILVDIYETESEAKDNAATPKTQQDEIIHVQGGTVGLIAPKDAWSGKYMNVFVRAVPLTGGLKSEPAAPTASQQAIHVKTMLPVPMAHLELVQVASAKYYQVVLENIDVYESLGIDLTKTSLKLTGCVGQEIKLSALVDGRSVSAYSSGGNAATAQIQGYQMLISSSDTYRDSALVNYQSSIPNRSDLEGTLAGFAVNFMDGSGRPYVQGLTMDGLSYTARIKNGQASIKEQYYRTELLAADPALDGTMVSVSMSDFRLPNEGTNEYPITLSNLPEDIIRSLYESGNPKVTVRTYMWAAQEYVAYYGRKEVISNLTAEEIKANDTYKEDGYIIYRNSADNYSVYFSSILAYSNYEAHVTSEEITLPNQYPAPAIENTLVESTEGEKTYTFVWDKEKTGTDYTGAQYRAIVTGTDANDQTVQIRDQSVTEKIAGHDYYELTLPETALSGYKNVNIQVTRMGSSYSGSTTTERMGSNSTADFKFYLKLDQPSGLNAVLSNGDRHNRVYDVIWRLLTNVTQLQDLQSYRLDIYNQDNALVRSESLSQSDIADQGMNEGRIQINLDDTEFAGATSLTFTVTAVARAKAPGTESDPIYTDSDPSASYTMEVPERLPQPNLSGMDAQWSAGLYDAEGANPVSASDVKTVAQFTQEGFQFELNYTGSLQDISAAYQMEAAIYDQIDANGKPVGDPLERLTTKTSPAILRGSGTMASGEYSFTGLSQSYAGKYLVLSVRATSGQQISSIWSEEQAYQLPKIQLATTALSQGTVTRTVEKINSSDSANLTTDEVTRQRISWVEDTYADHYQVLLADLHYNSTSGVIDQYPLNIHNQTLPGQPYTFTVESDWHYPNAKSTEQIPTVTTLQQVPSSDTRFAVYEAELTYGYDAKALNQLGGQSDVKFHLVVQATVNIETGSIVYAVVLPDEQGLESERNMGAQDLYYTGSVVVNAIAATDAPYTNSLRSQWLRIRNTDKTAINTWTRELEENAEIDAAVKTSDGRWRILKIAATTPLPCEVNTGDMAEVPDV